MPEQRSVLKELRDLDEKRLTQGLSPDEQARLARLRELARGAGASGAKPGFDVNAAAAALRESLLPAGLRHRPPPTPAPPPADEGFALAEEADALASAYEEAPTVAADEGAVVAPQEADALFDPSALGGEPPPYDPNAAYPADPNAAYAADPNAQPYDPDAGYAADPNAAYPTEPAYDAAGQPAWDPDQPWDPNAAPEAQPSDPNAGYAADPNAAYPAEPAYDAAGQPAWDPDQPWDPNAAPEAQPSDPNAYAADPSAAPEAQAYDPNAGYAADPNAGYAADPNAGYAADPNAAYPAEPAYDASGQPAWDPNQPWDPNAVADAQPYDPDAAAYPVDPNAPGPVDAGALPEGWDPNAATAGGGSFAPADPGAAAAAVASGWDAEPPPPEPTPGAAFGEYDAAGGEPPFVEGALLGEAPPPEPEPLYAEPFAAEPAVAPELGEYDDTAGFAAEPFEAAAVPEELALEAARPPPELEANWQPDTALDAGFQAESGGSFAAGADAAAPEWAQAQAPAAPPWEGAPTLDLGAPAEPAADGSSGYEVSPTPAPVEFGSFPPAGSDLFGAPDGDLAPVEELAPATADAGAAELDFSQPDLSGPAEAALESAAEPAPPEPFAAAEIPELPPEEAGGGLPPLDLDVDLEPGAEPVAPEPELAHAMLPEPELAVPELGLPPEPEPDALSLADLPPIAEIAEAADDAAAVPDALAAAAPEPEPDLSFDVAEEPPAAQLPEPPAADLAPAAAAPAPLSDDDIPTIDGADILEEIVEDVSSPPPQSLDFEPIAPERPPAAVAPPPAPVLAPPPPPVAAAAPTPVPGPVSCPVPGSHRVVVHTVEGLVRRGVLDEPDLASAVLALAPQAGAPTEEVTTEKVKAIFFMLAPGEKAPPAEGKRVRVTFRDGRQIAGFSPDYREDGIGFFMIPADTKTNTGRIWVFRAAVRQVSVS